DTATGTTPWPLGASRLPYCSNPLPCSVSAVTLNCWPDTLKDAARAPCARATPIAAVAATLGTMTTANRLHLVPPRTCDSILPPSRTYISGGGRQVLAGDGRSATSSGRRAPGIGEPVRPGREFGRRCADHRRSPPSDNHWQRSRATCWTGSVRFHPR